MRTRVLAVCVVVATALVSVTGCSSGKDGESHAARPSSVPFSAAAVPTTPADTVRFTSLMRRLAAWSDEHRSVTATEHVDTNGRDVRYDGLFTWGAKPAMDIRVPTAELGLQLLHSADKTEVLLVDDCLYYRVDSQVSGLLKGRHWVRTPLPKSAGGASAATRVLQTNPEDGLRMLPDATGWTDLGQENVDDTVAEHYQGTVTRAALSADKGLARALGTSPSALLVGADSAEIDVWSDAHDKPIRWFATLGSGRTIAVDFFHFGGPRPITPPPARDTATVPLPPDDAQPPDPAAPISGRGRSPAADRRARCLTTATHGTANAGSAPDRCGTPPTDVELGDAAAGWPVPPGA